ncbi:hypothetical protein ECANGB1_2341 [Enterospora canceri]|uniref:Uncharacterized protein n=1 Tax=Enterospora canceri TaxID=1081671 RepID=A0A1Y1S8L8_9MICR|nr:hypothetical protein ECANGB1_2341 [Enterospora canceri]
MNNMKSVKEYDAEIKQLKEEVFDLKTQLAQNNNVNATNIPKMLYENSNVVEELNKKTFRLENENKQLRENMEIYKNNLGILCNEKAEIENKLKETETAADERIGLLEDENRRLLNRLNKIQSNETQLRSIIVGLENEARSNASSNESRLHGFQSEILNMRNENEILKAKASDLSHLRKQLDEYSREMSRLEDRNNQIITENNDLNNEINKLKIENQGMNNSNMTAVTNNRMVINDLNQKNEQLMNENRNLVLKIESANENVKFLEEKLASYDSGTETRETALISQLVNYKNGMVKFRSILNGKLEEIKRKLIAVEKDAAETKACCKLSDESLRIIQEETGLREDININKFINGLKIRINGLQSELSDTIKRNKSLEKTRVLLEHENNDMAQFKSIGDLKSQIAEAMEELALCRGYMQKKAKENTDLKNTNAKLTAEHGKIRKQLENARKFYDGVTAKYGANCVRI